MKISFIQTTLFWEDRARNLAHFDELLAKLTETTDVIVLPEMFTTGFSMFPEKVAEPAGGPAVDWMKKMAAAKKAVVTGSVAVKDEGKYYNRLYWVEPSG